MGAHRIGALGNRFFNDACAACVNVIFGKAAFGVGNRTDRPLERAGFVFGPIKDTGLIKMQVAFDKAATDQLTVRLKNRGIAG